MSNRLHLVIGFDSPRASAKPTVIYCGRDGDEARAAMEPESAYAVKKWVRNPRGVRKVNDSFLPSVAPLTGPVEEDPSDLLDGQPDGDGKAEGSNSEASGEGTLTDDQPVTVPVTDITSPVETLPITEPAGSDLIPEASPGSMSPRRGRS